MRQRARIWAAPAAVVTAVIAFVSLTAVRPQPAFSASTFTAVVVDSGNSGDCKAIGDVNGDGLGDGFHGGSNDLAWYRSPGGTLTAPWTKHVIAAAQNEFTTFCVAADIDRDGAIDIVSPDNGTLWWFRNPRGAGGDPTQQWQRIAIGTPATYFTHDVRVGDISGDGKPDVVTRASGVTTVWTQVTTTSWTSQNINQLQGEGLNLGDIDGDGRLDVVVGGYWQHNPDWTQRSINGRSIGSSYVADMNGDGRADVVLSSMEVADSQPVTYWTNPSPLTGSWTSHTIDATSRADGHNIEVRDFDGDGRLDVLVPRMFGEVAINWNGPSGWTKTVLGTQGGHNLAAGDMNGDAAPEVFGGNYLGNPPVRVWRNSGAPPATTIPAPTTTAAGPTTTAAGPTTTAAGAQPVWSTVTPGSNREPAIAIPAAGPNTSGVTFYRNGALNRRDATPNPYQMYPPMTLVAGDVLRATWTNTAGQARESTHVVGSGTTTTTVAPAPTTTQPAVTTTTPATTTTAAAPTTTAAGPTTTAAAPTTTAAATTTVPVAQPVWAAVTAGSNREPEIAIPAAGPNASGVTFYRNGVLNRRDATPNPYQMYPPMTLVAGDVLRATWTNTAGQARESTRVVGT